MKILHPVLTDLGRRRGSERDGVHEVGGARSRCLEVGVGIAHLERVVQSTHTHARTRTRTRTRARAAARVRAIVRAVGSPDLHLCEDELDEAMGMGRVHHVKVTHVVPRHDLPQPQQSRRFEEQVEQEYQRRLGLAADCTAGAVVVARYLPYRGLADDPWF